MMQLEGLGSTEKSVYYSLEDPKEVKEYGHKILSNNIPKKFKIK